MKNNNTQAKCPLGEECPAYEMIQLLRTEIEELKSEVRTDHLTGLFNIKHLTFTLEQEIERTKRSLQPTTLIMLDIDHFKKVNDTYGHLIGDLALKHIANILQSAVRKLDIPCRYGGEEFAILLPSTPLLVGSQVAERVRQRVENSPLHFEHEGKSIELNMTASLGVDSFLSDSKDSSRDFMDRVDQQLYIAKKSGRNQVSYKPSKTSSATQINNDEKDALFNMFGDD